MTSKERVISTLKLGKADKVPFFDTIHQDIETAIVGKQEYHRIDVAEAFGLDALECPDLAPPIFATVINSNGIEFYTEGMIKDRNDLALLKLPDPRDESMYDEAKRFVERYGNSGYALYIKTRLGPAAMLNSMGLDNFSYALADDPALIEEILDRYSYWSAAVIEHINKIGFDFLLTADDLAYKTGLLFSKDVFTDIFLPRMKIPASACKIPWILHSDGNIMPIIDELLTLGMSGLHPIEPGAMDIGLVKKLYGKRVCLVGNIDLGSTLTMGTVEDVDREVKERIDVIGHDGGYIIASSNSIPNYCKVENVKQMVQSINKYRDYK